MKKTAFSYFTVLPYIFLQRLIMRKKMILLTMVIIALIGSANAGDPMDLANSSFESPDTTTANPVPDNWVLSNGAALMDPLFYPDEGISAPAAVDGDQSVFLNASTNYLASCLAQPMTQGGSPFLIAADQTYTVKMWVGRIIGQDAVAPQLMVEIAELYTDVMTDAKICMADLGDEDLNGDCEINLADFAMIAAKWLDCQRVPECINSN